MRGFHVECFAAFHNGNWLKRVQPSCYNTMTTKLQSRTEAKQVAEKQPKHLADPETDLTFPWM
jgi:hypothetical protein